MTENLANRSESRIENSIKNLKTAWICQLLMIILKFITRKLFTQNISDEYLGLENLYVNIIGILSLAELGISSAIGYSLYRPLAEKDEEKVASIMRYMGVIFKRIAIVILCLGLGIAPFLEFFAPEISHLPYAYLVYLFYVLSTVVSYLLGYKSSLCSGDQQNYIYIRNHYFYALLMNIIQGVVLLTYRSYIGYATVQLVLVVAEGFSLSFVMDRKYPLLKRKDVPEINADEKKKLWNNVKYLAVWKIGYQLIASTDTMVISKFLGLAINGLYGNYILITSAVATIFDQIASAVTGSVGNLVVKESEEKKIDVFWQLQFAQISLYVWGAICIYNLVQPFIAYWIGSEYWLDSYTIVLILISFYLRGCRSILNVFRSAYGLFKIDSIKAPVEALLNLAFSIILSIRYGVPGVVWGTILSTIIFGIWLELLSLNQVLHVGVRHFIFKMTMYTLVATGALVVSQAMCAKLSMHWYSRLPLGMLVSSGVFIFFWCMCFGRTHEFQELKRLIYSKGKSLLASH